MDRRIEELEREVEELSDLVRSLASRTDGRLELLVGLVRTTTADLRSVLKTLHDALDRRLTVIERVCRTGHRGR